MFVDQPSDILYNLKKIIPKMSERVAISMYLNANSIKKLERQLVTIHSWPELETRHFLDDHKDKALELVLTLKHYANPIGGYPIDPQADEALANVLQCLSIPERLQPGLILDVFAIQYPPRYHLFCPAETNVPSRTPASNLFTTNRIS